jgi:hypothetical protein
MLEVHQVLEPLIMGYLNFGPQQKILKNVEKTNGDIKAILI